MDNVSICEFRGTIHICYNGDILTLNYEYMENITQIINMFDLAISETKIIDDMNMIVCIIP